MSKKYLFDVKNEFYDISLDEEDSINIQNLIYFSYKHNTSFLWNYEGAPDYIKYPAYINDALYYILTSTRNDFDIKNLNHLVSKGKLYKFDVLIGNFKFGKIYVVKKK